MAEKSGISGADGSAKGQPNSSTLPSTQDDRPMSPLTLSIPTPNSCRRQHNVLDIDNYFFGPRDIQKHSKWPLFLQMHGSILPKMIFPLLFLGGWATCIVCVNEFTQISLGINSVLLTVTGFVVGLGLSFRSSTAYERYNEGRKSWGLLTQTCQALGRVFWIHCQDREEQKEKDLIAKVTAMNLLTAFAIALKHKLRYEPSTAYADIADLVGHLDTFAGQATKADPELGYHHSPKLLKTVGTSIGLSFAQSNPRKELKKARYPIGNLPLEIIGYLAGYVDEIIRSGQLSIPMQHTIAYNNLAALNDVLTQTERILTTPVPVAYAIAISQITWLYVLLLPFQLVTMLHWVTIPGTIAAGYIILGLLFIGREIEDPFGNDVNDLPLDTYCEQISRELGIIAAKPRQHPSEWIERIDNKVMWPLSSSGWHVWAHRGEEKLRAALKAKSEMGFEDRQSMTNSPTFNCGSDSDTSCSTPDDSNMV